MKLAVITDSSAYLTQDVLHHDDLFILEIPIYIDGESYVEGKNLTHDEFYQKMAASKELPKTSQLYSTCRYLRSSYGPIQPSP